MLRIFQLHSITPETDSPLDFHHLQTRQRNLIIPPQMLAWIEKASPWGMRLATIDLQVAMPWGGAREHQPTESYLFLRTNFTSAWRSVNSSAIVLCKDTVIPPMQNAGSQFVLVLACRSCWDGGHYPGDERSNMSRSTPDLPSSCGQIYDARYGNRKRSAS